jgi:hypothetical protein
MKAYSTATIAPKSQLDVEKHRMDLYAEVNIVVSVLRFYVGCNLHN